MAKQKYYYIIVRKDNGEFAITFSTLPIFRYKQNALIFGNDNLGRYWRKVYTIQKIKISDLENLILKSKKA